MRHPFSSRSAASSASAVRTGPTARRLQRARLGDARLWLGLGLVLGAMVVGARVMAVDEDTVIVLRATRDLSVGSPVDALEPVRVSRSAAGAEYLQGVPDAEAVLRWPIRAGELVPRSALTVAVPAPVRHVTVPVDPLHVPPALMAGDLVDVWSSPPDGPDDIGAAPRLVLAAVTIDAVSVDDVGLGGEIGVVLAVPVDDVADVVAASRVGLLDLVAVPIVSQEARLDASVSAEGP